MKRIAILLALAALPFYGLMAQDSKETSRQEKKEQRKKEQQQIDSASYSKAVEALSAQSWVLEANTIRDKRGYIHQVSSMLNFVMVENEKGTVQLASPYKWGYNGLGGITVEGSISAYRLETDKKGNVSVSFYVMGVGINATITVTLYAHSNQAEATIEPNTWGRRITYSGNLFHFEDAGVYKGFSL